MKANQAGITALITAYARAYHATHASPVIFDDFLAADLFSDSEVITFNRNLAGLAQLVNPLEASSMDDTAALDCVMRTMNCPITVSRGCYAEESLAAAAQTGCSQYVILGAGLDTFVFRKPDLAAQLQVFEVDHPVTQQLKRQRVAGWKLAHPDRWHLVAMDFEQETLAGALATSQYDPARVGLFSWLGVTYYLTREAVCATLRSIAEISPAGSSVVFDYMDQDAFRPERAGKRVQTMQMIAQAVGEPMKCGFDPADLPQVLAELGLRLEESLSPNEIEDRYFRNRQDNMHAFENVHFARALVA
jgi:methyltransferase (TIGR00027 family)